MRFFCRAWCAGVLIASALIMGAVGCGGRKAAEAKVETGSESGRLATVQISPAPGDVYIPRSTTFQIAWSAENPPPAQFEAVLMRYKEARGEEDLSVEAQRTEVSHVTENGFVWSIRRTDNFDLDKGGVYYLRLTAPGESVERAFIVSRDRSRDSPANAASDAAPAATDNNHSGAFTHVISAR